MKTVALHIHRDSGRQRSNKNKPQTLCLPRGKDFWLKFLQIAGLVALFFGLLYLLPISRAYAADNSLPPLDYEIRDPVVPGNQVFSPFVPPPPQWQSIESMTKAERRVLMVQLAAQAIGGVVSKPIAKAILAVQEPIRTKNDNIRCRTKLNMKTYYMRCGFKF
jgi:hypothetical protein